MPDDLADLRDRVQGLLAKASPDSLDDLDGSFAAALAHEEKQWAQEDQAKSEAPVSNPVDFRFLNTEVRALLDLVPRAHLGHPLLCDDPVCCPLGGELPKPREHTVATAQPLPTATMLRRRWWHRLKWRR